MALTNRLVVRYVELVSKDVSKYLLTIAGRVHPFYQVAEMSLQLPSRLYRVLDLLYSVKRTPSRLPLIEPEESDRRESGFHGENVRDILEYLVEVGS